MTRRLSVWIVATAVLGLSGCSSSRQPTGPTAALDEEFTLAPGGRIRIGGTAISLQFQHVDSDSRCPDDAICVLGGDAEVRIGVDENGRVSGYELHTGTMAPVRHDDLVISLVALSPYPFSARPIAPSDYRVTLRVTR